MAFSNDSVIRELEERLEAVEKRKIAVRDLPLQALKTTILQAEPQDPTTFLLPKSVTGDVLADGSVGKAQLSEIIDWGEETMEWQGVSSQSAILKIAHKLNTPRFGVVATCNISSNTNVGTVGTRTSTSFELQGNQVDGSIPAAGQKKPVSWWAFILD